MMGHGRSGGSFEGFTDDELRGLARAMDGAAGEGAFGDETDMALAQKLVDEAKRRGWEELPLAFGHGGREVDHWIQRSRLGGF